MYRKSIFITLISLILVAYQPVVAAKKSATTKSQKSEATASKAVKKEIVQMFQSYLSETRLKPINKKMEGLISLKKLIQSYRKTKPMATPEDEIFMDMLEGVMGTFPMDGSFKASECKTYRSQMQSQFHLDGMGEVNSVASEYAELWHHLCGE